jgi:hypothetical protein
MRSIPAQITEHDIVFNSKSLYLFKQKNKGKWADLVIRKVDRTLPQLGMYRAWLNACASQTGNDPEELHEFLIEKLAPRAVMTIKGRKGEYEIERPKRTSGGHQLSMDKLEMGEFMDRAAALTDFPLPTEEELRAMGYLPH